MIMSVYPMSLISAVHKITVGHCPVSEEHALEGPYELSTSRIVPME